MSSNMIDGRNVIQQLQRNNDNPLQLQLATDLLIDVGVGRGSGSGSDNSTEDIQLYLQELRELRDSTENGRTNPAYLNALSLLPNVVGTEYVDNLINGPPING